MAAWLLQMRAARALFFRRASYFSSFSSSALTIDLLLLSVESWLVEVEKVGCWTNTKLHSVAYSGSLGKQATR